MEFWRGTGLCLVPNLGDELGIRIGSDLIESNSEGSLGNAQNASHLLYGFLGLRFIEGNAIVWICW